MIWLSVRCGLVVKCSWLCGITSVRMTQRSWCHRDADAAAAAAAAVAARCQTVLRCLSSDRRSV